MEQTAICPVQYVGADVHAASTTFVIRDAQSRIVGRHLIPTRAAEIVRLIRSLPGEVHLTFEEGSLAAWLHDLLEPWVQELVVCNPARIRLLGDGCKSDGIDAEKLSELLVLGQLRAVYHGEKGTRRLKQLVMGYAGLVRDSTRVKNKLKAVFRSRGIATPGDAVYDPDQRATWLETLDEPGIRQRAEWLYRELETIASLRAEAQEAMLAEAKRHRAAALLQTIPGIGVIRAAQLVALLATPHRFRNKRTLWSYAGFAVVTRSSSDYRLVAGQLQPRRRPPSTRGLNPNHSPMVKAIFKAAAIDAAARDFKPWYDLRLEAGMRPEMARLALARKIAAIVLTVWKKGERFDPTKLISSGDMTSN